MKTPPPPPPPPKQQNNKNKNTIIMFISLITSSGSHLWLIKKSKWPPIVTEFYWYLDKKTLVIGNEFNFFIHEEIWRWLTDWGGGGLLVLMFYFKTKLMKYLQLFLSSWKYILTSILRYSESVTDNLPRCPCISLSNLFCCSLLLALTISSCLCNHYAFMRHLSQLLHISTAHWRIFIASARSSQ